MQRGEIGLQRPLGANVRGADFITAVRDSNKNIVIIATDVKTTTVGKFPVPKQTLSDSCLNQVPRAVDRLAGLDPALENEIRSAAQNGRIIRRQIRVDYSPQGQGSVAGF